MQAWYKVVTPRKEVREGRSFNPDEFAIALEQVVAKTAPEDYRDPEKFFRRTYFTRALKEHTAMVLRRLAGETVNTAPVVTLVTQFGGGKTHTLTTLYHLAKTGPSAAGFSGVPDVLKIANIPAVPKAKVAVFVGNAWDPQEGRENPWLDLARQLAGDAGVAALGPSAQTVPPGTEALGRLFQVAGGCVLVLFDEVLNFINRYRGMADAFHAFIQNLTVAMTGTTQGAAVISLPRSQVEMTDWDHQWQEKITKVVRRVSKDLIANDEREISEVIRRRLFEDLGSEKVRAQVALTYANWCFERRHQLPPEWTVSRDFLQQHFEACYPFHPATLSVFQRKWQTISQYQQTRGTLAMLAQWVSLAQRDGYSEARTEPLITLGSAPLEVLEFRSIVLGQLGESRLGPAITTDICGKQARARVLDIDSKDSLADVHRRVGTAILFESSGGQVDKVAHLPELRFALGELEIDTTSIDTAASALEARGYYFRKVGTDGYKIGHKPTMKKVVNDRKASLDDEKDVWPAMEVLVRQEFEKGRYIPCVSFPKDGSEVPDSPRLTFAIMDPVTEWSGNGTLRQSIAEWTRQRGGAPRLYPGALVWCLKKQGQELLDKTEDMLAWKRVKKEVDDGTLGGDFERGDLTGLQANVKDAEEAARDEVWAGYRFVIIADTKEPDSLKVIDLGAGHASSMETLCGRIISALKSEGLLSESVGAGYIDRNWPEALRASGAWPLASLRQSFLNGSLTRLTDPDAVLRVKIPEFVARGEFGLGSGQNSDGSYARMWFDEMVSPDEVTFDRDIYLLSKAKAIALKAARYPQPPSPEPMPMPEPEPEPLPGSAPEPTITPQPQPQSKIVRLNLSGTIPPESWNRLGTKLIPKLRAGSNLEIAVSFKVDLEAKLAKTLEQELGQMLEELGLPTQIRISST